MDLNAMLMGRYTVNVRGLRRAEGNKQKRAKQHKAAVPGGKHGQG